MQLKLIRLMGSLGDYKTRASWHDVAKKSQWFREKQILHWIYHMQHANPSPSCAPCWDTEGAPFTEVLRKTLKNLWRVCPSGPGMTTGGGSVAGLSGLRDDGSIPRTAGAEQHLTNKVRVDPFIFPSGRLPGPRCLQNIEHRQPR